MDEGLQKFIELLSDEPLEKVLVDVFLVPQCGAINGMNLFLFQVQKLRFELLLKTITPSYFER